MCMTMYCNLVCKCKAYAYAYDPCSDVLLTSPVYSRPPLQTPFTGVAQHSIASRQVIDSVTHDQYWLVNG